MILSLLALVLAGPTDATGVWKTPRGATVRVERCGPALCGRILTLAANPSNSNATDINNAEKSLRSRPLKGLPMLQGFTGGPTRWSGGTVYNPEDGKTYSGNLELTNPNALKLTGCAFRIFCKSQIWARVG